MFCVYSSATMSFFTAMLIVCFVGCGPSGGGSDNPLNNQQVEAALKSPDVKTIRHLYERLVKEPVDDREKKWLGDVDARAAEFRTFDSYIDQFYVKAATDSKTPEEAKKAIKQEVTWKVQDGDVTGISRVYTLQSQEPTDVQRAMSWGAHTYFRVFTEDNGRILAWMRVS